MPESHECCACVGPLRAELGTVKLATIEMHASFNEAKDRAERAEAAIARVAAWAHDAECYDDSFRAALQGNDVPAT